MYIVTNLIIDIHYLNGDDKKKLSNHVNRKSNTAFIRILVMENLTQQGTEITKELQSAIDLNTEVIDTIQDMNKIISENIKIHDRISTNIKKLIAQMQ